MTTRDDPSPLHAGPTVAALLDAQAHDARNELAVLAAAARLLDDAGARDDATGAVRALTRRVDAWVLAARDELGRPDARSLTPPGG